MEEEKKVPNHQRFLRALVDFLWLTPVQTILYPGNHHEMRGLNMTKLYITPCFTHGLPRG